MTRPTPLQAFRRGLPSLDLEDYHAKLREELQRRNRDLRFMLATPSEPGAAEPGAFHGVPVTVKDALTVRGLEATAGSRILQGYVPVFTATAVERLERAGGVVHGKTAMDEFGFGTFGTNCAFGAPRNPWDPSRVTGGSSGGAGVAAALLAHHVAIAESTGGSISSPASFCGAVGLTPTYGRISRWGLIDYANSLDKIGVITRSTRDGFEAFNAMLGPDAHDATSQNPHNLAATRRPVKRIGVMRELVDASKPEVAKPFRSAMDRLAAEGVAVQEVSFPLAKEALAAYYVLACSEASTNLAKYCGLRYGPQGELDKPFDESFAAVRSRDFGAEAKRRVLLGTYARMAGYRDAYYLKATRVRGAVIEAYRGLFRNVDVLASPTMPILPPRFEEVAALDPVDVYALDAISVGPNLAAMPHLSVPCGYVTDLPVGLQFVANQWDEGALWDVGERWEAAFPYRFPANVGAVP